MAEDANRTAPLGASTDAVVGSQARIGTWFDNPATGESMPGVFRVELDQLPRLRADLEAVRAKYDEIYEASHDLRVIPAPGRDEVSQRAVADLGRLSGDEDGCLGWCASQASQRVTAMIEQIERIEATYRAAEDASEMGGS